MVSSEAGVCGELHCDVCCVFCRRVQRQLEPRHRGTLHLLRPAGLKSVPHHTSVIGIKDKYTECSELLDAVKLDIDIASSPNSLSLRFLRAGHCISKLVGENVVGVGDQHRSRRKSERVRRNGERGKCSSVYKHKVVLKSSLCCAGQAGICKIKYKFFLQLCQQCLQIFNRCSLVVGTKYKRCDRSMSCVFKISGKNLKIQHLFLISSLSSF